MGLVPHSILETRWREALGRVQIGTLTFIAPDGTEHVARGPQPGPIATFAIKEWNVLSRLVARGDIGLGEDFIAGAWETDDVERLVSFFLLNLDHFEGFAHGNFLNRLGFVLHTALVRRNSVGGAAATSKLITMSATILCALAR